MKISERKFLLYGVLDCPKDEMGGGVSWKLCPPPSHLGSCEYNSNADRNCRSVLPYCAKAFLCACNDLTDMAVFETLRRCGDAKR